MKGWPGGRRIIVLPTVPGPVYSTVAMCRHGRPPSSRLPANLRLQVVLERDCIVVRRVA
jgi:hypothetical protein